MEGAESPAALASWFVALSSGPSWVARWSAWYPGARQLAFQRAEQWVPPNERCWLAAPRRLAAKREPGFRVFADPVGHAFCLVFG